METRGGSQGTDPGWPPTVQASLCLPTHFTGVLTAPFMGPREEDAAQGLAVRGGQGTQRSVCLWDSKPPPCPSCGFAHSPLPSLAKECLGFRWEMPWIRRTPPRMPRITLQVKSPWWEC